MNSCSPPGDDTECALHEAYLAVNRGTRLVRRLHRCVFGRSTTTIWSNCSSTWTDLSSSLARSAVDPTDVRAAHLVPKRHTFEPLSSASKGHASRSTRSSSVVKALKRAPGDLRTDGVLSGFGQTSPILCQEVCWGTLSSFGCTAQTVVSAIQQHGTADRLVGWLVTSIAKTGGPRSSHERVRACFNLDPSTHSL